MDDKDPLVLQYGRKEDPIKIPELKEDPLILQFENWDDPIKLLTFQWRRSFNITVSMMGRSDKKCQNLNDEHSLVVQFEWCEDLIGIPEFEWRRSFNIKIWVVRK